MIKLRPAIRMLRSVISKSWVLSRFYYRWHGIRLTGRPDQDVWYFAFGANMHDSAFCERRGMRPIEWRPGRVKGYRLRFNLEGRPKGKAAPANISPDPNAEVWGVLYRITRADLLHLDWTEGVPGGRYRHLWVDAEDIEAPLFPSSPTSLTAKSRMAIHHRVTSPCFARARGHTVCPNPI